MAKPQIIVNAGDPGVKAAVSASTSWTATLDSTDGVRQVEWAVTSTDETTTAASYTLVTSGSVGQTVTSTSQGQGTALILWVRVNAGKVGDQPDPENTEATVKIYVPLADGGEVGCAGEEYESDPTFGATGIINQGIRKAAALSPSGIPVKIVRAATSTALPANTRTNNILTASSNGAIGTVGGVAVVDGDHILVKDEGGVAAHVNDGPYVLADGDGSSPWTLTRATYFDASEELIPMTTFRIQEGTYAGKEFYLATSGATINVTALEFAAYAYAPNDAAYLCVGSSGFLSNEVNVSAIGTTVEFTSTSTVPFATKRTDSATAALVDVEQVTALSSGTAAAGFGPSTLYKGEVFGGGAENYGRIGFAATDLTNTSEDTKLVVQARTAGASLATCAEFSGTAVKLTALGGSGSGVVAVANDGTLSFSAGGGADASAKYLTDAASTVNANDVPTQSMTGTLNFFSSANPLKVGRSGVASSDLEAFRVRRTVTDNSGNSTGNTAAHIAFEIPNGSGTATDVANIKVQIASTIGPSANIIFRPMGSGTMADALTVKGGGIIQFNGLDYQHDGYRLVLDASGNLSASVVSFDEVKTALAAATSAVTIDDDLIVSGDLTVSGTTTTVDSTTVSLADRLIVLNSSTGTVPVPVDIAGFVIDRGSADGVTKRDMPGLFWDETNTRFDLAYNTSGDQSTIGSFVGLKLSALTVSGLSSGFVRSNGSGVLSSSALASGDVTGALGYTPLQGSGTTNALPRYTASTTLGGSGITDDGTTVDTTRLVTYTCDAAGSTQARGVTIVNNTVSGTQYTKQHGFTAFHSGGTQWNIGSRLEVVNASRARQIWYSGSGSGVPSAELFRLDTQDDNFGAVARANAFAVSGSAGYRFDFSNNRGGLKYNTGSDYIYLESYNGKDVRIRTGADSGGSSGVDRLTITGTGTVTATWSCPVIGTTWTSTPVNETDAASLTVDLSTGLHRRIPLTLASTAITLSNARAGTRYLIHVEQDATGGRAVTWTDTIAWGTVSSSPDTTAQHFTIWELYCYATSPSVRFIALGRNADNIP
jgi:hypothetical protein